MMISPVELNARFLGLAVLTNHLTRESGELGRYRNLVSNQKATLTLTAAHSLVD